jgi:chromatin structure-remodeling complex subunit RSC1/2
MPSQTMPQTPLLQHQSSQPHQQPYHQTSASPAPAYSQAYASHPANYAPQTPHLSYTQQPQPLLQSHPNQYTTPHHAVQAAQNFAYPASRVVQPYPQAVQGHAPRIPEVFHLADTANNAIPAEIRNQFQRDAQGRILFFSTPPIDPVPPVGTGLRHTPAYLAAKIKRDKEVAEHKRKLAKEAPLREAEAKKRKMEEEKARKEKEKELVDRSLVLLGMQLDKDTKTIYKSMYPNEENKQKLAGLKDTQRTTEGMMKALADRTSREAHEAQTKQEQTVNLKDNGIPKVYLDDIDPRIPFN